VKDVFADLLAWSLLRDTPSMEHETDCIVQSNSRWMLSTTTRTVAASIVLLVSCSGLQAGVLVVPIGSLQHGVVFYLDEVISGHPAEFTINGSDGAREAIRWLDTRRVERRRSTIPPLHNIWREISRPRGISATTATEARKQVRGFRVHKG
jgi:hypothetical protein